MSASGLIGSVVAAILSSAINHSFWWGFFHFLCGWLYVIYWFLIHTGFLNAIIGG